MFNEERKLNNAIRWGMVGGGRGSVIGHAHRAGAARDGLFQLQAGAFDLNEERGREFGTNLGVDASRCYKDYQSMFAAETARADGIQAVSIATPNRTRPKVTNRPTFKPNYDICIIFKRRAAFNKALTNTAQLINFQTGNHLGHLEHMRSQITQDISWT